MNMFRNFFVTSSAKYTIKSLPIALFCYSKVFICKGFLNFIELLDFIDLLADFIDYLVYFMYAYEAISVFCWGCNSSYETYLQIHCWFFFILSIVQRRNVSPATFIDWSFL